MEVGVVGSGSNLLGAGKGARGPVVKPEGDLSKIDVDETNRMILCCGGTRLSRGRGRGHGQVPPDGRAP